MKKTLSILLIVTLLISTLAVNVFAANNGKLTVNTKKLSDTQFEVSVVLSENPGIAGMVFGLSFDKSKMVPSSYTKGTALGGSPLSNLDQGGDMSRYNEATFQWSNPSNVVSNGTLLTIVFDLVTENWGSTEFEISYNPGDIANQAFDDVNPTVVNATLKQEYTVKYDANGGNNAPKAQTKVYGEKMNLSSSVPTRIGYDFCGWAKTSDATESTYVAGAEFTENTNCTLYAVWEAKSIVVSYDTDCELSYESKTVTYDGTYGDLPSPSRTGYNFEGWYLNGSKITSSTIVKEESNHTLIAKWKPLEYNITFNLNGGTLSVSKQTKFYNQPLNLTEEVPVKTNYTFIGWSESSSNKKITYFPGDEYTANKDLNLYAVWELTANMPIVTVESNTGRAGEEVDVNINIENNKGIAGFVLGTSFDNSKLTPVSVTKGAALSGSILSNIDQGGDLTSLSEVYVQWANPSNVTTTGTLYTIKFKIAEGLEDGIIPLKLFYEFGDVSNQTYDTIYLRINQGHVEVINVVTGDVFEDGTVNSKDAIRLSQYLAKWSIELKNSEKKAADIIKDDTVNTKDAIKLAQYLAKWDVTLD